MENTLPKHGSFVCKLELEILELELVSVIKLNPNLKERRTTTSLNDLEGKIFNVLEMQTIFEISPNG